MPKAYNTEIISADNTVKACITNAQVSFKKTRETCNTLRGRSLEDAMVYLANVLDHAECVPMLRYNGGCGNTKQAQKFMNGVHPATKGRWPAKSCNYVLKVLRNLKNNAMVKGIDPSQLVIQMVSINKAPKIYGRCFRAHGRVNSFNKSPCHIQCVAVKAEGDIDDQEIVEIVE
ncbi:RL17 [Enterospora canceri]|uniref:RL17 n=1 Tax=Enterospora canceri TaxID=1081671 RepID=A0A1Y1S557_9MICR|nr:RL17 [Enterospora canceri]